jgi:signal transduction histidine kinase
LSIVQKEPGLASTNSNVRKDLTSTWLHRWIYYLATGFLFAAVALRSAFVFQESHLLGQIILLLAACLSVFIVNILLASRYPGLSIVLIGLETLLVLTLLLTTRADFFAILFSILCMQAMQQFSPRLGGAFIGLGAVLTFLILMGSSGVFQALALAVGVTAVSVFAGAFLLASRRAGAAREKNLALAGELREANRRLQIFAEQQEQLAAARERQHLARELHDSITQTIFSMNLTTQSALLLLDREPAGVAAQLERLDQLAGSALAEMQLLIARLAPEEIPPQSLEAALRQHLSDRLRLENLSVDLQVEGDGPLEPAEEQGLFRIAQEALNNIIKHAGVNLAVIRLNLTGQPWLEIEDYGAGFDLQQAGGGGRLGLAGMRERAVEIRWTLRVESAPGSGTRIRVAKYPGGVESK